MRQCGRWFSIVVCFQIIVLAAATLEELESRATALKAAGDAAGALAAYQEAATLDPKSARYQDEIGFLLRVLNRGPEASEHFRRAVELDPQYAPAHFHFGVALFLEQDTQERLPSCNPLRIWTPRTPPTNRS